MSFIKNYLRLDKQLVRKMYPLPRIGKTMQQLEGFHYATTLDQNMGYYILKLLSASQYMTTIVPQFGIFRYNFLSMGMCSSGYIFQTKVNDKLGDIKDVKKYINDVLILNKD